MSQQTIRIEKTFNAPASQVFEELCDHERFGEIISAPTRRIVDASGANPNGEGSVRRVWPLRLIGPGFEETVTRFEPNERMEYKVTRGSPLKNHLGRMAFSEDNGRTRLDYTITFEPRVPIPLLGPILRTAIGAAIDHGLQQYADELANT